jgi:hypothetical protein
MLALIAFLLLLIVLMMIFKHPGARTAFGVLVLGTIIMTECGHHDVSTVNWQCNVENNNCGRGWK